MERLLKKLRHKVVLYVFNHYYGHYMYSFDRADAKIAKMNETEKQQYYEDVTAWVKTDAYELEDKNEIAELYAYLAAQAANDDIMTAYRLALLKLKDRDVRLRSKVDHYTKSRVLKRQQDNFK